METIQALVRQTRTVRRFQQDRRLTHDFLCDLIDCARLGGSTRNAQPLQYMPVLQAELCNAIFPALGWAGYLTDWEGPAEGERPPAYIICLSNKIWERGPKTEVYCDLGIATQSMLLAAAKAGVYGCRIAFINKTLHKTLQLAEHQQILLVVALGFPNESVVLTDVQGEGDVHYWRDVQGVHYVPKRTLQDILVIPPDLP